MTINTLQAALDVRFDSDAGEDLSVREYLRALLLTLWEEGEGFSGKRPFGNSGWEYDLYKPLIKAGFIQGRLDEEGYVWEVGDHAHAYVSDLILKLCSDSEAYAKTTGDRLTKINNCNSA